jgi:hypothetical protein
MTFKNVPAARIHAARMQGVCPFVGVWFTGGSGSSPVQADVIPLLPSTEASQEVCALVGILRNENGGLFRMKPVPVPGTWTRSPRNRASQVCPSTGNLRSRALPTGSERIDRC